MNTIATIARILLGLVFTIFGASSFFLNNPPPLPGMAGTFNDVFIHSHWSWFLGAAQLVMGVFFLINRFVPIALIILAAFLYNSFAFHITMLPGALPAPVIVLILGAIVAMKYRPLFAPLFEATPSLPE